MRRTILVVDDEPGLLQLYVRTLENLGYTAKTASTAEEAFLAARSCDLVVTDLGLSGSSGLDLIGWLRRSGNAVPIVAVSGYPGLSNRALKLGAAKAFNKPWDLDELEEVIEELLGT